MPAADAWPEGAAVTSAACTLEVTKTIMTGNSRREIDENLGIGNRLSLVNRQETVIHGERQQRKRRADLHTEFTANTAIRLLRGLELADEQLIPLFPRIDVPLEQGLGFVVSRVISVSAAIGPGEFDALLEEAERRLELGQILPPRDGVNQSRDGDAGGRLVETTHAGVGDLSRG